METMEQSGLIRKNAALQTPAETGGRAAANDLKYGDHPSSCFPPAFFQPS
jgi:hypothetical protein